MRDPGGNRDEGLTFEMLFERQALLLGLFADRNHLKAKRAWKGRLMALSSNLDFTLIDKQTGRVGFFDCKSFEGQHFTHSRLAQHQRELAARYNSWHVPAGFVVFFRDVDRIVFYSGKCVAEVGAGNRFNCMEGVLLGPWSRFDLRLAMSPC